MNNYNKLKDIIYSQKKCISVANLCYMFDIHIDEAQSLVSEFVNEATKDGKELDITYTLSGYKNEDGDEIKLQRFITAKQDELEEAKKYFTEISSSQIRTLSLKGQEHQLNGYDKNTSIITTNDELLRNQKVSRITNSSISLRQDLIRKFNYQNGFSDETPVVKEFVKKLKNDESKKEKSNTKSKNNSKKLANFFTKVNSKTNDKSSQKINEEKEAEEPKIFESEDEEIEEDKEDPIPSKRHKSVQEKELRKPAEKRKRIRVFNESDSESSQQASEFNDNDNEEPKQKIAKIADGQMQTEIMDEIYEDEDGYIVTKKVTKMIKIKNESEDLENEENIRQSKETKLTNKNGQIKKNSKKGSDKSDEDEKVKKKSEESEKKPKGKIKAMPKGQVAITSFFKPAMK